MSERKWRDSIFLGEVRNRGEVKLAVLLALAAVVLFLIVTVDVQRTTAGDCDCSVCHGPGQDGHNHAAGWQGCATCHGFPPPTGSHLTHFQDAGGVVGKYQPYGDTRSAKDYYTDPDTPAGTYLMGCGNCHPLDNASHQNGTLDVELYNASAPADSLKAKNPQTAAYTPGTYTAYNAGGYIFQYSNGTCTDIYCHSGYTVASTSLVGDPLTYPANPIPPGYKLNSGRYIMDETCSNLTYAPYTFNYQRVYKTTPAWGTTVSPATCTECHEFPLTTYYPDVYASVGDSHRWVNEYGYNYGHANNMEYYPGIPCATCHNATADHQPGSLDNPPTASPTYWTQVNGVWTQAYYPVPVKNRALHVNGAPDVSFDTANGYRYYYPDWINTQVNLSAATYDPATKTCSDVGCHYGAPLGNLQKKVKWGSPYRGWEGPMTECDQCHRMGYLQEGCQ